MHLVLWTCAFLCASLFCFLRAIYDLSFIHSFIHSLLLLGYRPCTAQKRFQLPLPPAIHGESSCRLYPVMVTRNIKGLLSLTWLIENSRWVVGISNFNCDGEADNVRYHAECQRCRVQLFLSWRTLSTTQRNADMTWHDTIRHDTTQHSTAQHNVTPTWHDTIQHNTAQHETTQNTRKKRYKLAWHHL